MSGTPYQRPRYATGLGKLTLPRLTSGPGAQQINNAFQMLELADQLNLKLGQQAQVSSLLLTDADGVTWRLGVTTDGQPQFVKVLPR